MTLVPANSVFISLGQARELRSFGMRAIINSYSRTSGLTARQIPQAVLDFLNDIDAAAGVPVPSDVRAETSAVGRAVTLVPTEAVVTTATASDVLDVTKRQVVRLLDEGHLRGRKVNEDVAGSPWLVDRQSLDELVAERGAQLNPLTIRKA